MPAMILPKAALGATAIAGAAWLGFSLYRQPRELAGRQAAVTGFLERALAGDSAGLVARSASAQPVRWAIAAVRTDSSAVREWASHGGAIELTRRGDTLWVARRHHRSTERCAHYSTLVATLLAPPGARPREARLLSLTATCPAAAGQTPG